MAKKKANVRKFELGEPPIGGPYQSDDASPVEIPIRTEYSVEEITAKSRRVHVSFCQDDTVLSELGWSGILQKFVESRTNAGDTVTTANDSEEGCLASRLFIVFTNQYVSSDQCSRELEEIVSNAALFHQVSIVCFAGALNAFQDTLEKFPIDLNAANIDLFHFEDSATLAEIFNAKSKGES